jgi:hypothetical protein
MTRYKAQHIQPRKLRNIISYVTYAMIIRSGAQLVNRLKVLIFGKARKLRNCGNIGGRQDELRAHESAARAVHRFKPCTA